MLFFVDKSLSKYIKQKNSLILILKFLSYPIVKVSTPLFQNYILHGISYV